MYTNTGFTLARLFQYTRASNKITYSNVQSLLPFMYVHYTGEKIPTSTLMLPFFSNLCILWRAVLMLQALSCPVLGALWLRGGLASTAGLDEWPTLSLQLDVCCQAHWHLLKGGGEGGSWGGGWVENPGVAKRKWAREKRGKLTVLNNKGP